MPKPAAPKWKVNWRLGARVIVWSCALASIGWAGKQVGSFLGRDARFDLACHANETACPNLEIHGAIYANRARIFPVFAADFGRSIFLIPLAERRRHLLAVDWVNTASIERVWPNRIVVILTERRAVAFAKLPIARASRYRLALIDAEGVLLSIPARVRFQLPVLSGVTEDQTESERAVRVGAMQRLLGDLGPDAQNISEVDAANVEDIRLITTLDRHAVELWVGDDHYRSRYQHFLSHYPEIRKHSAQASVFDLRMDDRILARQ